MRFDRIRIKSSSGTVKTTQQVDDFQTRRQKKPKTDTAKMALAQAHGQKQKLAENPDRLFY